MDLKAKIERSGIFEKIIPALFPKAQHTEREQILVNCPFHSDTNPSLSVNTITGLFNCFACDAKGNGFDLYMKMKGLDFRSALKELAALAGIQKEQPGVKIFPKVVATFTYHDVDGKPRYWKKRYEPGFEGKRKKSFAFYHENEGRERKGRGGDPLLYNLHLLSKAGPKEPVFVLEGEAKCDVLASWGLIATTLDSGGQSGKGSSWREKFKKYFKDREVIILPDNDSTGEKYANSIIEHVFDVARVVKVLRLPDLPPKGDILDWCQLRGKYAK